MQIVSARPLCARSGEIILTVRRPMSALPPKADITAGLSESPLCAKSGHMQRSKKHLGGHANSGSQVRRLGGANYSALMPAALTIGYHLSTSALWEAAKNAGRTPPGGGNFKPKTAVRLCAPGRGTSA